MRIIFVGRTKRRTQAGKHLVDAFRRAGCDVLWLRRTWVEDLVGYRWLIRKARRFRPNMLFLYTHKPPMPLVDALHADKIPLVFFLPSIHVEPEQQILELTRKSTLFFITNTGQLDFYRDLGASDPRFLTQGFDPRAHYPDPDPDPRWRSQLAFIGRHRPGDKRDEFIAPLTELWDVKIYGLGWEKAGLRAAKSTVYPPQYRSICGASEIVLGFDTQSEIPLCFSNRTWLTLGCGGFLLTTYVPRLEELFENRRHLVWYRSPGECRELIEYYLSHPEERREIAQTGHKHVLENYTYDHIAKNILKAFHERTNLDLPHPPK
ncbi:MAG: glycosyltransferase [bacterium]